MSTPREDPDEVLRVKPVTESQSLSKGQPYPDNLPKCPGTTLIIGPTMSGKTTVVAHLLCTPALFQNWFNGILIASPFGDSDRDLAEIRNKNKNCVIIDKLDGLAETLLDWVAKTKAKMEKDKVDAPRYLVFIDDFSTDRKFYDSPALTQFVTTSRHAGFSFWICGHKFTSMPPLMRQNCQTCLLFPQSEEVMDLAVSELASDEFPKRQLKKKLMAMRAEGERLGMGRAYVTYKRDLSVSKGKFRYGFIEPIVPDE